MEGQKEHCSGQMPRLLSALCSEPGHFDTHKQLQKTFFISWVFSNDVTCLQSCYTPVICSSYFSTLSRKKSAVSKKNSKLQIRYVKLTSINIACIISSPNFMFAHLFKSTQWYNSNKWSNIKFGEEICIIETKIHALATAMTGGLVKLSRHNPYG